MPVVGFLRSTPATDFAYIVDPFRQGLNDWIRRRQKRRHRVSLGGQSGRSATGIGGRSPAQASRHDRRGRRSGGVGGLTRVEDEISMYRRRRRAGALQAHPAGDGRGASRAVSSNSSSAKRYGLALSWESRDLGSLRLRHRRRRVGGLHADQSAYEKPNG